LRQVVATACFRNQLQQSGPAINCGHQFLKTDAAIDQRRQAVTASGDDKRLQQAVAAGQVQQAASPIRLAPFPAYLLQLRIPRG
jgi:hypothetical protein